MPVFYGNTKMLLRQKRYATACLLFCALALMCCRGNEKKPALFQLLRKESTGLQFENELRQTAEFNVFNYMYFFNGGGVGAGDFNNDGHIDLYFTRNMGPNKIFLNAGNRKCKDITEKQMRAGL